MKTMVCLMLLMIGLLPALVFADPETVPLVGIGEVAGNLLEITSVINEFMRCACFVLGGACLFSSFVKFLRYRENHLAVPISTVFMLFFMGTILLSLPLAYKLVSL